MSLKVFRSAKYSSAALANNLICFACAKKEVIWCQDYIVTCFLYAFISLFLLFHCTSESITRLFLNSCHFFQFKSCLWKKNFYSNPSILFEMERSILKSQCIWFFILRMWAPATSPFINPRNSSKFFHGNLSFNLLRGTTKIKSNAVHFEAYSSPYTNIQTLVTSCCLFSPAWKQRWHYNFWPSLTDKCHHITPCLCSPPFVCPLAICLRLWC